MVKTKRQQSKPKKQPHVKKQGKPTDISQFRAQLDGLGLQIIQVTADGNCFFRCLLFLVIRALADQLEGDEEQHGKYRCMVVQYISKNRESFEPFIEDDVPFDEYCESMQKDGTWAGHMELQAASLVTSCNICIHRFMAPRWYIKNFDKPGARMVHLSYHDEEHYNSVRLKEDICNGPAIAITIKADADLSASSTQAKAVVSKSKDGGGRETVSPGSIKLVMAGTGCENAEKVEQVDGDVDAAIEFLIAAQGTEECEENDSLTCQADTYGDDGKIKYEQCEENPAEPTQKQIQSNNGVNIPHGETSLGDEKKIPRNKSCPCGSKKKYKACCGSVSGRSLTKLTVNQVADGKMGRKDRKQGKKGGFVRPAAASSDGSEGAPPDVGALCI